MKPTRFALCGGLLLIAFTILPAWRLQLFSSFEAYAATRLVLFATLAALFWRYARGFDVDLSVGNTSPVRTGYGDPLLSLRAMACFIVLLGHGSTIIFVPADIVRQATSSRGFWLLMPMPWAGVWIFFTLSGYLMGKAFFTGRYRFSRDDILYFYRNRLLRIAPLYYFAILLVALFLHPEVLQRANLLSFGLELLFDYEGTRPGVIGLLWSVATEMQFYLTVPFAAFFLSKLLARHGVLLPTIAILACGLIYRVATAYFGGATLWVVSVYCPLLGNLDIFALGMLTSLAVQRYPLYWPRISHGIMMSVILYVIAAWCWCKVQSDSKNFGYAMCYLAPTFFALATAAVILTFEHAVRQPAGAVASVLIRRTQWLGILTYAIYIWHDTIMGAYAKTLIPPLAGRDTIAALLAEIPLVVLFAWVTWLAVEKPFDDFKAGVLTKRRRAVA